MNRYLIPIAGLAFLLSLYASAAPNDNIYVNRTAGISVTKPTKWHFAGIDANKKNLDNIRLKDQKFEEDMRKYATTPLIAMMRHEEPYDDLNASFKLNIKPLNGLPAAEPQRIVGLFLPQLEKIFEDYKLIEGPTKTTVSGLKAGYAKIHYSMKIPDGRTFPICSELWIVPRGDYFFLIGAGTPQVPKDNEQKDLNAIIESIKLDSVPTAVPPPSK